MARHLRVRSLVPPHRRNWPIAHLAENMIDCRPSID